MPNESVRQVVPSLPRVVPNESIRHEFPWLSRAVPKESVRYVAPLSHRMVPNESARQFRSAKAKGDPEISAVAIKITFVFTVISSVEYVNCPKC